MSKTRFDICGSLRGFAGAMAAAALLVAADANATDHTHHQDIEFEFDKGDLAEALTLFSAQSGISVIFDNRLVGGFKAPALMGAYDAREAMSILLADAGLQFREVNDQTWAIVTNPANPAGVRQIPETHDASVPERKLRDEIIVTASYQTPSIFAGTRALYTLDSEQMRLNGALNIAEPIFELPASVTSVSAANTALLLSSGGLNLADLRGLGPERTLVLVNGRRYIRTSGGNGTTLGVDLNSIPAPFVERIEVVNQGAGAAIGMEAVAGAVNIITREEIDGLAITADGGVSQEGDASEYSVSVLGGKRFLDDRGRITLGVTYASEPSLPAQARENSFTPFGFEENGVRSGFSDMAQFSPGFGGSSFTPNSRLSGAVTQAGDVVLFSTSDRQFIASDGQSFEPYVGGLDQLYNWLTDFAALPEIERLIGYGAANYELTPSHSIYAEVHIANTKVATQIASSPVTLFSGRNASFGDGIFVSATNPFAPAGLQAQAETIVGAPVDGFLLDRRFVELGPRMRDIERQTLQIVGGIEGSLGGDWRYDISYQYGGNRTIDIASGIADGDRLATALDASACALVAGCTPINIFAPSSITPAQADFIRATPRERIIKTREQIAQMKFSGPIYENRGAQGFVTAGLEHRRERVEDEFDSTNFDSLLGEFSFPGTFGKIALTETYINGNFPLVVDAPLTRLFEIGGAYRLTIRQGTGEFSSFSGNTRWAPVEGLEIYAHIFRGGRSPNVMEQFSAGPDRFRFFSDPCDMSSGPLTGDLAVNCATLNGLGVGAGFVQDSDLTRTEYTGNPTLEEERVNSRLIGVTADIHALIPSTPGLLTISADWRRHQVTNAATSFGVGQALEECYHSDGLSNILCGVNPVTGHRYIQRDPVTRQIVEIETTLLNGGTLLTSGLDARLQYFAEFDGVPFADMFAVDILYTYIHRVRQRGLLDDKDTISEGLIAFPRHQIHATASFGTDELKTVWTVRRRGKASSFLGVDDPAFQAPATTYVDMALQWRAGNHAILYAGVENLFDREIPIVAGAPNGFYFEHYDPIGRRFFAGVKAEF